MARANARVLSSTTATAIPTESIATSSGSPCRPGTKLWWYSSLIA
jgi:hypothetical protein